MANFSPKRRITPILVKLSSIVTFELILTFQHTLTHKYEHEHTHTHTNMNMNTHTHTHTHARARNFSTKGGPGFSYTLYC